MISDLVVMPPGFILPPTPEPDGRAGRPREPSPDEVRPGGLDTSPIGASRQLSNSSEVNVMSAQDRVRLPNRRLQVTKPVEYGASQPALVSTGFDAQGIAREVFVEGLQEGSDMQRLGGDACLLASLLLQQGYSARELLEKLMKLPSEDAAPFFADDYTGPARPSLVARALDAAIQMQEAHGPEIREFQTFTDTRGVPRQPIHVAPQPAQEIA